MNEQVDLSTIPISPGGDNEKPEAADSDVKTVFHDKENFNVKHPLQNKWTLWFTKPPSGKVWPPPINRPPKRATPSADTVLRATTGMTC